VSTYSFEKTETVDRIFSKLEKRNPKQLKIIYKKLEQICNDPYLFKPLRNDMKNIREVHIDKHFVLLYSVDESRKIVILKDYNHHDKIFGK
jgi:YafQ family addiction module toxin component